MKAILIVALLLWPSIATAADDDVLLGVTLGDDGRPYLLHLPIEGGCADFLAAFQKAKKENRKTRYDGTPSGTVIEASCVPRGSVRLGNCTENRKC
jgi:hypothetical protein